MVFLTLYNAIMGEAKDTRGSVGRQGAWACDNNEEEEEEEWLDISEVAFVDDMLSSLVYDMEDEVEVWATRDECQREQAGDYGGCIGQRVNTDQESGSSVPEASPSKPPHQPSTWVRGLTLGPARRRK